MSVRRSWIRWSGVAAALCALSLLSCKEAVMEPLTVAAVEVAGGGVNLRLGQTVQLTPTLKSAKGYVLPKVGISWSSSDAAKAAISPTGQVTAQARGPVTLTASAGGVSGTAAVTVIGVQSISLAPETLSVIVTQTRAMTATTVLDPGVTVTPTWRSLDTAIARVGTDGRVTATSTTGIARIEVTAEDKKDTAVVRVVPVPVVSVVVSPDTATRTVGQTLQLTATPKDSVGGTLTGRVTTWVSSDTARASVSGSGLVTVKAAGSATISATIEGKSGSAVLTLKVPVANVTVAQSSCTGSGSFSSGTGRLYTTETCEYGALVSDQAGNSLTDRTVTWTSSDTTVAKIDGAAFAHPTTRLSTIRLLPRKAGTVTLTAAVEGKSNSVTLTVLAPVVSVTVTPATTTLTIGATQQLTATLKDGIGAILTGRAVSWSSLDTSRATVSSQGLVLAKTIGSTTITATSEGISGAAAFSIISDSLAPTTISVPGTSNIFGYGVTAPDAAGGGGGGGTLAPTVDVSAFAGGWVEFSVSGQTDAGPGWGYAGADGYLSLKPNSTNINSLGPISGFNGPSALMLVGLFIPSGDISALTAPSPFSYSSFSDYTRSSYSPLLRQIFFVGDGLSGNNIQSASGSTQKFFVPIGAQKLVLGFADGNTFTGNPGWYGDNKGSLTVNVKRVAPAASTDSLPLQGLIAFLPMNGNTADSSGTNNHFTNSGGTFVSDRFGNPASAISFAGNTSQATRDMSAFPKDSFTVAFWYRNADVFTSSSYSYFQWGQPTRVGSGPAVRVIIDQNSSFCKAAGDGFAIYWWTGSSIGLLADTTENGRCLSRETVLTWRHVAIVVKGSDLKVYDNGVLWAQKTVAGWTAASTTAYIGPLENFSAGSGAARQIDSFGIWNRPLSAQEVALVFRSAR